MDSGGVEKAGEMLLVEAVSFWEASLICASGVEEKLCPSSASPLGRCWLNDGPGPSKKLRTASSTSQVRGGFMRGVF